MQQNEFQDTGYALQQRGTSHIGVRRCLRLWGPRFIDYVVKFKSYLEFTNILSEKCGGQAPIYGEPLATHIV